MYLFKMKKKTSVVATKATTNNNICSSHPIRLKCIFNTLIIPVMIFVHGLVSTGISLASLRPVCCSTVLSFLLVMCAECPFLKPHCPTFNRVHNGRTEPDASHITSVEIEERTYANVAHQRLDM